MLTGRLGAGTNIPAQRIAAADDTGGMRPTIPDASLTTACAVLSLLTWTTACDPAVDTDPRAGDRYDRIEHPDDSTGEDDADTDGNEDAPDTPEDGDDPSDDGALPIGRPAVPTVTACVADGGILGYCAEHPLLLPCDAAFATACDDHGGYLTDLPAPAEPVEVCDDDNVFTPTCTDDWFAACKEAGGAYDCIDHGGDGGCIEAQCCFPGECD
ncbi:MAG: hypothetical protein D6705_12885 [Deltaproteobacteria bacterium]|nr:MAG: hypothetical protein D6705_12885 [Deltaproteobacteria bacterium]